MIYSEKCPLAFHLTSTEGARSSTSHEWKCSVGDPYSYIHATHTPASMAVRGYSLLFTPKRDSNNLHINLQTKPTSMVQSILKIKLKMEKMN